MRPAHIEQGPHATRTTYEVVGVSLKVPWCATHKAEYEKQKGVQDVSIWVALILLFAGAFVIGRIDVDLGRLLSFVGLAEFEWLANPVLLLIVGSVVVMVAIAILRSFVLRLLSKRKRIDFKAAFSVGGSRDWVALYFDNPRYANMFAKANSWLPKQGAR